MPDQALARLSLLKSESLLNESSTDFDEDYKFQLIAATSLIERFTARSLILATYQDELYTGNDKEILYLDNWPVEKVIEVRLWDGTDSYDVEDADYYALVKKRYLQYPALGQAASATWSNWASTYLNGIKITYAAGYSVAAWQTASAQSAFGVPSDLEYACAAIAQLQWMEGKKGGARRGVLSKSVIAESLTVEKFVGGLSDDVKQILNKYRRLTV